MSRVEQYTIQGLAHAGFVILDSQTAVTLREDLWGRNGGMEAAFDFGRATNFLNGIQGVRRFTARIKGRRDCQVLARGVAHLAQRIEWVTGLQVLELWPDSETEGQRPASERPMEAPPAAFEDRWHGIHTKQPARTCSECSHFTAGHACNKANESGEERPAARALRRCLSFTPMFESLDNRTGRQLWPELINLESNHGK